MAAMSDTQNHGPAAAVRAQIEKLTHMIGIARALAESGRPVDLTGFDDDVGLLCAKALDLPADEGRKIRPLVIALSAAMDSLSRALAARQPSH